MKDIQLTHFYPWKPVPDLMVPLIMQDFADNGAKNLVLIEPWLERLINEPGFCGKLKGWLRASGMNIFECHGAWGLGYDLNITELPRRKGMIEDHKLGMEYAAFFGCKTYTVHMGPYYEGMEKPVFEALEQLIPAAEKAGIILAIENGFDPGNSPDALLQYLKAFPSKYFAWGAPRHYRETWPNPPQRGSVPYCFRRRWRLRPHCCRLGRLRCYSNGFAFSCLSFLQVRTLL